jgi:hypothetical protein
MAADGVNPFTLTYIFGWSDIRIGMRYTHTAWQRIGNENENGGSRPAVSR